MWSQVIRYVSSGACNYVTTVVGKKTALSIELFIALNNIDDAFCLKKILNTQRMK